MIVTLPRDATDKFYVEGVRQVTAMLPRFDKYPDRINYNGAPIAVVVHCMVWHADRKEILLVERSRRVGDHQGLWSGISGFYDRLVPPAQVIGAELTEEVGLTFDDVEELAIALPYFSPEPPKRSFITVAALARVNTRRIRLNPENNHHQWIHPDHLHHVAVIPGLPRIVNDAFALTGGNAP